MKRKFILGLILLMLVATVSVAVALNDTDNLAADNATDKLSDDMKVSDDLASDDKDTSKISNKKDDKLADTIGQVTVKKVWVDNNDASGKRPKSVNASYTIRGDGPNHFEISEAEGWTYTIRDLGLEDGDSFEIKEDSVDGYTSKVTGSPETGYVITNTLKDQGNSTPANNDTKKDDTNKKSVNKNTEKQPVKKTITKTNITKTVSKNDKKDNKTKDKHNTGFPILLGVLAVSGAGLALALRRRE